MFRKLIGACVGLTMIGMAGSAGAAVLEDQSFDGSPNWLLNGGSSGETWQQQVTAGLDGQLSTVEVRFYDPDPTHSINFSINVGSGWQTDANDFEIALNPVSGWNSIDVSAAGIMLSIGDMFSIGLEGTGTSFYPGFTASDKNPYAGGALYLLGAPAGSGNFDMNFRTFVDVSPTPLPAALPLFLTMLSGMGFLKWRRGKRQAA